jgi:ketosteroid isomerase-like protein
MRWLWRFLATCSIGAAALVLSGLRAGAQDDGHVLAALDSAYQAAVAASDVATIDRLLPEDFALMTGRGRWYSKADFLREARDTALRYEHQQDTLRTVRVWGNTGVVTALLWATGRDHGKAFEYRVWFSDTYARTASGWRYVFGQSSTPLPPPTRVTGEAGQPSESCASERHGNSTSSLVIGTDTTSRLLPRVAQPHPCGLRSLAIR